jgi:hypothetical protein
MKKGELTTNYIIVIILALVVLIVVGIVFRNQIMGILSNLKVISSGIDTGVENNLNQLVTP